MSSSNDFNKFINQIQGFFLIAWEIDTPVVTSTESSDETTLSKSAVISFRDMPDSFWAYALSKHMVFASNATEQMIKVIHGHNFFRNDKTRVHYKIFTAICPDSFRVTKERPSFESSYTIRLDILAKGNYDIEIIPISSNKVYLYNGQTQELTTSDNCIEKIYSMRR